MYVGVYSDWRSFTKYLNYMTSDRNKVFDGLNQNKSSYFEKISIF